MCSTCCALGVVGEYREPQFVIATGVVIILFGKIGGEGKIMLKCFGGRMKSE